MVTADVYIASSASLVAIAQMVERASGIRLVPLADAGEVCFSGKGEHLGVDVLWNRGVAGAPRPSEFRYKVEVWARRGDGQPPRLREREAMALRIASSLSELGLRRVAIAAPPTQSIPEDSLPI